MNSPADATGHARRATNDRRPAMIRTSGKASIVIRPTDSGEPLAITAAMNTRGTAT